MKRVMTSLPPQSVPLSVSTTHIENCLYRRRFKQGELGVGDLLWQDM